MRLVACPLLLLVLLGCGGETSRPGPGDNKSEAKSREDALAGMEQYTAANVAREIEWIKKGISEIRKGKQIAVTGIVVRVTHSDFIDAKSDNHAWFVTLGTDMRDRGIVSCMFRQRKAPVNINVGDELTVVGAVDPGLVHLTGQIELEEPKVVRRKPG